MPRLAAQCVVSSTAPNTGRCGDSQPRQKLAQPVTCAKPMFNSILPARTKSREASCSPKALQVVERVAKRIRNAARPS